MRSTRNACSPASSRTSGIGDVTVDQVSECSRSPLLSVVSLTPLLADSETVGSVTAGVEGGSGTGSCLLFFFRSQRFLRSRSLLILAGFPFLPFRRVSFYSLSAIRLISEAGFSLNTLTLSSLRVRNRAGK